MIPRSPIRTGIGFAVATFGLVAALAAAYLLLQFLAFAGIFALQPERVFVLPAIISTAAMALVAFGFLLARPSPGRQRSAFIVVLLVPSALVWFFASSGALLAVGQPLYRPKRTVVEEVRWKPHDHLADRAVFQGDWSEPYWWTFDQQPGLIDHLEQLGDGPVSLTMTVLYDDEGDALRAYLEEVEGFKLSRQFASGTFVLGLGASGTFVDGFESRRETGSYPSPSSESRR